MKFKSRKDIASKMAFLIMILGGAIFMIWDTGREGTSNNYIFYGFMVISIIGYIWLFFGTGYELTTDYLKYTNGPLRGKIQLSEIKEVIIGSTYWAGAAMAQQGLILKYGKFDELRITPREPELFIKKITEYNPSIKVTKEA